MHVEKYNKGTMGHMLAHYDRTRPGSKSNIDSEKTHLNYNLAAKDQPLPQLDYIHKRLSEIKVHNRKDVNVFCDWIVTAPDSLKSDEYKLFFEKAYEFLRERYGKENIISAYVHMDETTPHIHFAFIPVTIDKKKHIPKLCAKEVITKTELKSIHGEMSDFMKKAFDRDIGILNGATALGNLTINQLKHTTEQAKAVSEEIIAPKVEEMQKKRSTALGKAFKKEEIILSGDEIESIRNVFQQASAVTESAVSLSEMKIREKESADLMKRRYRERMAELDKREKNVSEREKNVREQEISAKDKMQSAEKLMNEAKSEKETAAELINTAEQKNNELSRRTHDPHGYYNDVIAGLKSEIISKQNIIHNRNMEVVELCNKNNELTSENADLKKEINSLNNMIYSEIERTERTVSEKYEKIISEKEVIINSLKKSVWSLKDKLNNFAEVIRNVCCAFCNLGYKNVDYSNDKYFANLNKTQYALIDGVNNYAADFVRKEGFTDYSDDIINNSGIDNAIKPEIEKLLPDEPKRYYSGFER